MLEFKVLSKSNKAKEHRWIWSLCLGVFLLAASCSISEDSAVNVKIHWQIAENSFSDKDQFLSELYIINEGTKALPQNWELFFNFSPCRDLSLAGDEDRLKATHISGDYHVLEPASAYTVIEGGDTLTLSLIGSSWAIKPTDSPGGFYFIFNKEDDSPYLPEFTVSPFTKEKHFMRTASDQVKPPSASSLYERNQRLGVPDLEELSIITPTPLSQEPISESFQLDQSTALYFDEELSQEAEYLKDFLRETYSLELNAGQNSSSTGRQI